MNARRAYITGAVVGACLAGFTATAQDANQADDINALKQQIKALDDKVKELERKQEENPSKSKEEEIQQLDQKVRVLERQHELDEEATTEKSREAAKSMPVLTAGANGFGFRSADTNFAIALRGHIQVDNRTFIHDGGIQGNDGFLLRRARPILQGTVYRDWDFMFVPDFAGSSVQIFDAYVNYRYSPWLQLRAGKFKVPVGLEQLQSDAFLSFNERALPTALVPNRDIGFMLWGDIADGFVSYAAGVFNGVGDARNSSNSDFEDHREVAGRVFLQPFRNMDLPPLRGFGAGVAGSWGNISSNSAGLPSTTGGTLPGYFTDGQQQFFAYTNVAAADGDHWRFSPQGYYYWGPVGVLGEYVVSDQSVARSAAPFGIKKIRNTAWELTGSWVLTGEDASYSAAVSPRYPFDPRLGHWGAVQLVGRYADLDIDNGAFPYFATTSTSATEAKAWSVGLNWYLNRSVKLAASYSRTTFSGGASSSTTATTPPGIVTRQPEEVFFTRLQLVF